MQFDVVTRLVPGFIVTAEALGAGRLILFVYEWRSPWPRKFGIYLVDNYRVTDSLSELTFDLAEGFLRGCYRAARGERDEWWKLTCKRVREQAGGPAE